jgi:hypothetical protein
MDRADLIRLLREDGDDDDYLIRLLDLPPEALFREVDPTTGTEDLIFCPNDPKFVQRFPNGWRSRLALTPAGVSLALCLHSKVASTRHREEEESRRLRDPASRGTFREG